MKFVLFGKILLLWLRPKGRELDEDDICSGGLNEHPLLGPPAPVSDQFYTRCNYSDNFFHYSLLWQRKREKERDRDRGQDRGQDRDRGTEIQRDRNRETETERQRQT